MDFTSFEYHELVALCKVLDFVRFESRELGASDLVGIPALGHLQARATETLWAKVDTSSTAFFRGHGFPDVAADPERMAIIKLHITRVANWDDMAETSKRGFIQALVFPFTIAPRTLDELLHFGDHFQRPQE